MVSLTLPHKTAGITLLVSDMAFKDPWTHNPNRKALREILFVVPNVERCHLICAICPKCLCDFNSSGEDGE
jgi:hypothetical protein